MIAFLRGTVLEKHPQRLIVDVNGVGYEVLVPLSTYFDAAEPGSTAPVSLHVHTHVREGARQLFGFASRFELELFTRLIGIPGIGKKTAERIGLELKDRLPEGFGGPDPAPLSPDDRVRADLLSALANLGYPRPAAEKAADTVLRGASADHSLESALRAALKE